MLKLRSKTCHIGPSINTRVQRSGDDREPYLDIPITISVTAKELASIVGDEHVPDAWFETRDGKLADPLLKGFAPYRFKSKFEHSKATLTVGLNGEAIDCGDCTLNKLVFEPQADGRTVLKLKIQCAATPARIRAILHLDSDQDVTLQFGELVGDDAQGDLPLEVDEDAPESVADALAADEKDQREAKRTRGRSRGTSADTSLN